MTNFKTLLKAELKFALSLESLAMQILPLIFGFMAGIAMFFDITVIFNMAGAIAFYQALMRLQIRIMLDTGGKDRTSAAFLYYKPKEVVFSKLIIDILQFFINLTIMITILMIIAASNGIPDLGQNFGSLLVMNFGVLSLYILISLASQYVMSFFESVMIQRAVGIALVVLTITPFMAMPYIIAYVPGLLNWVTNEISVGFWFIPFFNYVLGSTAGAAHSFMICIPVIYSILIVFFAIPFLAKKLKRSSAM